MNEAPVKKNGLWRSNAFSSVVSIPEYDNNKKLTINHYQVLTEQKEATNRIVTYSDMVEKGDQKYKLMVLEDMMNNNMVRATAVVDNEVNNHTKEIMEFFAYTQSPCDEVIFLRKLIRD